ncbi:recombination-related endonuclease [Escherichia phage EJP2]|nr:recombination-related endonuclease [Escherichia phage EJP2]
MLTIKNITMRNFFSFGNAPQTVVLDSTDISLVLGQNNDVLLDGADNSGRRNGVGKSALIQGIVYGLYGKSIGNDIKISNLVNKINTKNCEVFLEFSKDGVDYRVERGRSPTYFNFITMNQDKADDESRGEKKDTQEDLIEVLGISQQLFEHIVVLNANVEPFLSLPVIKQRDMIEELLGITQLTEKAELLKDMHKESKRQAEQEKFKIETITASNERIQQSISILQDQAAAFEKAKSEKIDSIQSKLVDFEGVDFANLFEVATKNEMAKQCNADRAVLEGRVNTLAQKYQDYDAQLVANKELIQQSIQELNTIDIVQELSNHNELSSWLELEKILKESLSTKKFKEQQISTAERNLNMLKSTLAKEESSLQDVLDNKCSLCKGNLDHDENHKTLKEKVLSSIQSLKEEISVVELQISATVAEIDALEIFDLPAKPVTVYPTLSGAQLHEHKLAELVKQLDEVQVNIYEEELQNSYAKLAETPVLEVLDWYSVQEVTELNFMFDGLKSDLEREMKSENHFVSQIETLKTTSLQAVSYDEFNEFDKLANHQEFLAKLLINKDSYVRKRIIEQNISFLNTRLQYYIDAVGSSHQVVFMNDLSVDITLNDQTYDFKQLSRGERTRVNIALSLAFRDTYESLYQAINLICIDEMIDVGLDSSGVMKTWTIFQDLAAIRNKNVFVISHREELLSKTDKILKITKEAGFSSVAYTTLDDFF